MTDLDLRRRLSPSSSTTRSVTAGAGTVDALASHLLHELCGIALLDCLHPLAGVAAGGASPPEGGSDRDRRPQGPDP